jgi:putative nucleotidyltransferase with HDIG domain
MKDEIRAMIPEFDQIRDEELRNKALDVWEDALRDGGWELNELLHMPFSLWAENVKVSFIEHVRTVCRLCMEVEKVLHDAYGERMSINRDYLIAGALLADVGKLIEYERMDGKYIRSQKGELLRHPFSGVGMAYRRGLPEGVMHVIATHSKEGDHVARSPESIIFHHADFIDFDLVSKKRPF